MLPPQQARQDKIWIRGDKYTYVTCHAAAHKQERKRCKVTNEVCRAEPTPARPDHTVPPPKGPHPHPSPVSQDQAGEKEEDPGTGTKEAGKERNRDKHQGRGREKVNARGEGRPTEGRGKGKERRHHERNRMYPAAKRGTRAGKGARQAHDKHNTATKHRRGGHQGDGRRAAPRTTARTAQTPHTPHTPTPAPRACGQRAPAAHLKRGQPGKGGRLNPDAPRHPRGAQPPARHASKGTSAGPPQPHTHAHSTWVADPDSPPTGRAAGGGGAPDLRRPSQGRKAPPRGRPSATPAARNDGSQGRALWGPHQPHPGHTGRGTPASRPGERAARGGTAPDTRCRSQWWLATPPGDGL